MVFYFSGTGNSKYAALQLAKQFQDTAYSIRHLMDTENYDIMIKVGHPGVEPDLEKTKINQQQKGRSNMSFIELTKERYSVRMYSDKPVEKEKLLAILEAGRRAPTSVNYQPQRILVLQGEEALAKVRACTPHPVAPLALLICYDKTVSWKDDAGWDIGDVDATIVATQMMYAAQELGLGSLWIGGYDIHKIKENFAVPDFLVPVALLDIGYPAEDCEPNPLLHSFRYPVEQTVYHNSYEGIEPSKPGRLDGIKH